MHVQSSLPLIDDFVSVLFSFHVSVSPDIDLYLGNALIMIRIIKI